MPNYNQAPKLYHLKDAFKSNNFYQLPQGVMDKVFQKLSGREGNAIKLITVLLGTLGNGSFGISEAWICERTGMEHSTYIRARNNLRDKGWIVLEDGYLFVLVDVIMDDEFSSKSQEEKEVVISNNLYSLKKYYFIDKSSDMKSPLRSDVKSLQCSDMKSPLRSDVKSPIINNNINNNIDNNININSLEGDQEKSYPIAKVISQETANQIIEKKWITNDIFLASTGKYIRVRQED